MSSWLLSDSQIIKGMASKMIDKYNKYWLIINEVLGVGAILDSRNKVECVEFYFNEIYGDEAENEIERVKNILHDLLYEYQDKAYYNEIYPSNSFESSVLGK